MSVKIQDKDKGYKKLLKDAKVGAPVVTVGIHAAEGQQKHKDSELTVLDIAAFNEFGLGVPERSFVRAWADKYDAKAKDIIASRMRMVVAGKITKEQALYQIGSAFQGAMQANISDGIPPPNAESTALQKENKKTKAKRNAQLASGKITRSERVGQAIEGAKPLIDTGQMRSSITFAVEDADKKGST